jgi:hypothetical protein
MNINDKININTNLLVLNGTETLEIENRFKNTYFDKIIKIEPKIKKQNQVINQINNQGQIKRKLTSTNIKMHFF